jgi:hypothetical protein
MEKNSKNTEREKVVYLEERLRNSYGQVRPTPEFIESLQHRLITPPRVILENRRNGVIFVLMAFGLVFGVIAFMIIRGIYRLISKDK